MNVSVLGGVDDVVLAANVTPVNAYVVVDAAPVSCDGAVGYEPVSAK